MSILQYFLRRLRAIWRSDNIHREIANEISFHIEMRTEENIKRGMKPEEARREAERQFGHVTMIKETGYDVRGGGGLEAAWIELRCTFRGMKRRPSFSGIIIATLAVGIGFILILFSVLDTVVLRPLSYEDSHHLVTVKEVRGAEEKRESGVAPGRLDDWNRLNKSFVAIAGSYTDTLTETSGSLPEQLHGAYVSPHFFSVFRVPAQVGRVFTAEEEHHSGPPAVVISHGLWQRRFGLAPNVVGNKLQLANGTYTIIGIMPRLFQYPLNSTEVWVPRQADPELMQTREARFYGYSVGRLKPTVTFDQAWNDLKAVQTILGKQYPKTDSGWTVRLKHLKDGQVGGISLVLWLLFVSAAILLLIACINVACLLLTQFSGRVEEVAIRRALGASRTVIGYRLFAEGFVYALSGSIFGCLLAYIAVAAIKQNLPEFPRIIELAINYRVFVFSFATCVAATVIITLPPIIQTLRHDKGLVNIGRGGKIHGHLLPRILVSAQIAFAMILLVGSSMFIKSLLLLQETDLGFQSDKVLTFRISASYEEDPDAVVQRHARTLGVLSSLPGVQVVSMSSGLPGAVSGTPTEFHIKGQTSSMNTRNYAIDRVVTAGYFQSLEIPIISGQTCSMDPNLQKPFEALVNQTFVNQYLQKQNVTSHTIRQGPQGSGETMRIVGVVGDVREAGYARAPEPIIYICGYLRYWPNSYFMVKTRDDPETMALAIRKSIKRIEPLRAIYAVRPLTDVLSGTLSPNRFRAWLISTFSAIALALAGIGLYGVSSYIVSNRIREFGIRVALGARPSQIWTEILLLGGRLVCIGMAIGLCVAYLTSRLIVTLLYSVGTHDASPYIYSAIVLCVAAFLAGFIPGRRAASIDPAQALREP